MNLQKELAKYNLTDETFQKVCHDIDAKLDGDLDIDWSELVMKYNLPFAADTIRKASSCVPFGAKFRTEYLKQQMCNNQNFSYEKELEQKIAEYKKEKQKLSDARIDYNKVIRQEARKESYLDMVRNVISESVEPVNMDIRYQLFNSESDLLVHLTDIHAGIEIDNWKNTFNETVLKQRIEKFISDIFDIRELHQSENCYIVIGEILSGIIHNNLRLQNNLDLIEQFKLVSELITSMLLKLASAFHNVNVYVTPGNHSRISPKKEDSLDGENMDVLLPFYLKARLQNITNIEIHDNNIEPEIAMFNIRGKNIFAAHGHKDKPSDVVQNFTMLFEVKPDIVLLGHRHQNGLTTVYDTKVIESGCVSGADQYAISLRKSTSPEQTVSVINAKGLLCVYDIQLK